METKLTGLAIGRLDAAYESVMTEYNTRKGFLSAQSFMLNKPIDKFTIVTLTHCIWYTR